MQKIIKKGLLFSLNFANTGKLSFLEALWQEYQKVGYVLKAGKGNS